MGEFERRAWANECNRAATQAKSAIRAIRIELQRVEEDESLAANAQQVAEYAADLVRLSARLQALRQWGRPAQHGKGAVMDRAAYYPQMPPQLPDETDVDYTGRLLGVSGHESLIAEVERYRDLLGCIWLYVDWRWLTTQLTTEQKELWADAVDEFGEPSEDGWKADRWWRDGSP